MSQPREGSRVSYIGRPGRGPQMGAEGQLLAITGSGGHVRWASGELTYEDLDDIVSTRTASEQSGSFSELNYSLEFDASRREADEPDLLRDSLGDHE